ncbi:zinc C4 type [Brachionus plicatilis]|uniref:Zinc C4 type n=1 Tax=Brachionus plicatilis TaxID=10195 RepID=A0A3M7QV24_BRAPC|nr:zinc C4 type [Brachionus plicatilis]
MSLPLKELCKNSKRKADNDLPNHIKRIRLSVSEKSSMVEKGVERSSERMEEEDYPSREILEEEDYPSREILEEEDFPSREIFHLDLSSSIQQHQHQPSISRVPSSVRVNSCLICGDRSKGIHYGVSTCGGRKSFFKRYYSLSNNPFACKKDENCTINQDTLINCKYCRLKKCVNKNSKRKADNDLPNHIKSIRLSVSEKSSMVESELELRLDDE